MKTLKLLLVIMLAALGAFSQQFSRDGLSLSISAKKDSMPYNKILVDVEIKNISNRNIKLLDYFNDKENVKLFFSSDIIWNGVENPIGSQRFNYSGGISVIGMSQIGKPGEALKFRTLKPQQVYRFTLNLNDLFEDPSTKVHPGAYIVRLNYFSLQLREEREDWFKGWCSSSYINIKVTN